MSIREAAFALCKEIQRWEFRQRVKGLLRKIDTTTDERTRKGEDYGDLGYYGRTQNLEILGYLAINAKASELQKLPIPISTKKLAPDELEILESAHRFIAETVAQCAAELDAQLPGLSAVLHPYSQIPYDSQTQGSASSPPSTTALIDAFKAHPGFLTTAAAIEKVPQIKTLKLPALIATTRGVEVQIGKHGLHSAPPEMHEIVLQPANPASVMKGFLFSLVGLRASLRNLAHLMYQAYRFDKLPVLDNDNVYELDRHSSHALGHSLSLMAQPSGLPDYPLSPAPGDIILAKVKMEHAEFSGEWVVDEMGFSFSREFGDSLRIGARKIDAHLNPYPQIIARIPNR